MAVNLKVPWTNYEYRIMIYFASNKDLQLLPSAIPWAS